MIKKIIVLVLCICLLSTTFAAFADSDGYHYYTPGPKTEELTFEKPVFLESTEVVGSNLMMKKGSIAEYDLLLRFDMVTAEISYEADKDVTLTMICDTDKQDILLSKDSKTKIVDVTYQQGSHVLRFEADGELKLKKITFTKLRVKTSRNNVLTIGYDKYGEALQTTVVVKTNSTAIKVNGGLRYIDYEDVSATALIENSKMYLPIHAAARAFSFYYEDYQDLEYAYLSNDNFEVCKNKNTQYYIVNGLKKNISDFFLLKDGKTYVPVRALAEMLGLTVGYKDGYAIIDDRICVKTILEDEEIFTSLCQELKPFDISNKKTGRTLHVSKAPQASDANDGSGDFPFATINGAAKVAKAGDTVIIHEGVYREEVRPQNDGTATNPIIFKAAEGENVTISAFEEQGDFVPYKNGIYQTVIPKSLGVDRNFIIMDGEIIREGVHPNTDTHQAAVDEFDPDYELHDMLPPRGDIRVVSKERPNEAVSENDLNQEQKDYWKGGTYTTMYAAGWTYCYGVITGSEKGKIFITDENAERKGQFGIVYYNASTDPGITDYGFITNHINTVDLPGEWYIDNESCILYMIPPEGTNPKDLKVEIKQRQRVVDLRKRKYVQFVGINTTGGGITMANGSEMCVVNGGEHKYISHAGLSVASAASSWTIYNNEDYYEGVDDAPEFGEAGFMEGGINNAFINTNISYSAASGIYLQGNYAYVENNVVSHTGYSGTYTAGITISNKINPNNFEEPVGGHTIVHNTVHSASRAVLQIGGGSRTDTPYMLESGFNETPSGAIMGCDIGYNHFYDANVQSRDTGVIYSYGVSAGNDWRRTQMHHNVAHDNVTSNANSTLHTTFYHDGMTAMYDTYSNVVWTKLENHVSSLHEGGIYIQGSYWPSNTYAWGNTPMRVYTGTKEDLTKEEYPYGKPFYAGAYSLSDERFMLNYERLDEKDKTYVSEATAIGSAVVDERGFGVLKSEEDGFKFKDVNLYDEGTWLEVYYTDNRLKFDWENMKILHIDVTKNGENLNSYNRNIVRQNYYSEDLVKESFLLPGYTIDCADVELSLTNADSNTKIAYVCTYPADYDKEVESMDYPPNADVIYFGTWDESFRGAGGEGALGTSFSNTDTDVEAGTYSCIYSTWDNGVAYYDREFTKDVNAFKFNVSTAPAYANQILEFRIDDPKSEPVATYNTQDLFDGTEMPHDWGKWVVDVKLSKTIPAGKHDIYVNYVPGERTAVSVGDVGSTNSYYMAFYDERGGVLDENNK